MVSKSSCPSSLGISEHGDVNEMKDGDIMLSRGNRMSTVQLEKRRPCKLPCMLILGICVISLQPGQLRWIYVESVMFLVMMKEEHTFSTLYLLSYSTCKLTDERKKKPGYVLKIFILMYHNI